MATTNALGVISRCARLPRGIAVCRPPTRVCPLPPSPLLVSPVVTAVYVTNSDPADAVGHVDTNGTSLTSVGYCWTPDGDILPTVDNSSFLIVPYAAADFVIEGLTGDNGRTYYARAFVVTALGIYVYSDNIVDFVLGLCLLGGTNIAVWAHAAADAAGVGGTDLVVTQRPVESVWYDDDVVAWDFERGVLTLARPMWLKRETRVNVVHKTTLARVADDGSSEGSRLVADRGAPHATRASAADAALFTVGAHRAFHVQSGEFTPLASLGADAAHETVMLRTDLPASAVHIGAGPAVLARARIAEQDTLAPVALAAAGAHTATATVASAAAARVRATIDPSLHAYNVITAGHMNVFANGVLTSCRYNNRADVDTRYMTFCPPTDESAGRYRALVRGRGALLPVGGALTASANASAVHLAREAYGHGMHLLTSIRAHVDDGGADGGSSNPDDGSNSKTVAAHGALTDAELYMYRMYRERARSVLFLDHQGVMRTARNDTPGQLVDFDTAAVAALNILLAMDPALEIVVVSDWQYWVPLDKMREFYDAQGVARLPVAYAGTGSTPRMRSARILQWLCAQCDGEPVCTSAHGTAAGTGMGTFGHPAPPAFASGTVSAGGFPCASANGIGARWLVIDDMALNTCLAPEHVVQTLPDEGLAQPEALRAACEALWWIGRRQ